MKLLIADDHLLLAQGLSNSLVESGISCTIVVDLDQTLDAIKGASYDIILLNNDIPGMQGIYSVGTICKAAKQSKVLLFGSDLSREFVYSAIGVGAYGFVPKYIKLESLKNILMLVESGQRYLPPNVFDQAGAPKSDFNEREVEIIRAVANGATNKEIALFHSCSEGNVKALIRAMSGRLSARNRAHLVTQAQKRSII